jgi:uncharacterized protein YggU (UPF0235/DUF167 family)
MRDNILMLIKVKVTTGSKEDLITKKDEDSYIVNVREKAERGQANQKVKAILSSYFRVPSGKIKLVKGGKKQNKIFEINA